MIIRCPFSDEQEHDSVTIILSDGRVIEVNEDYITAKMNESDCRESLTETNSLFNELEE